MVANCAKALHVSAVKHLSVIYQNRMEYERVHGVFSSGSSKGSMRWRRLPRAPDLQPPKSTENNERAATNPSGMDRGARTSPPNPTQAMQPPLDAPQNLNGNHSDHPQIEKSCPDAMRIPPAQSQSQAAVFREHFRPRPSPDSQKNERARQKSQSNYNDEQNENSKRARSTGKGGQGKRKNSGNQAANQRKRHQAKTHVIETNTRTTDQRPQGRTQWQPPTTAMLDPAPPAPNVQQSTKEMVQKLMQAVNQPVKRRRKGQAQQPVTKKPKVYTQTSLRSWRLKRAGDDIEIEKTAKKGRGGAMDGGGSLATAADVYPQAPPEQPQDPHIEPRQGTLPQPLASEDWDHG